MADILSIETQWLASCTGEQESGHAGDEIGKCDLAMGSITNGAG